MGELRKTATEFGAVLQIAPELAEAHVNLGLGCHSSGEPEQPGRLGAILCLGIGYAKLNQPVRALPFLRTAIQREPGRIEAVTGLASALCELEKNVPYLDRAVRLKPDLLEARRHLGKGDYQLQRHKEAEQQLKLALAPERDGSVYYLLGTVCREMGRTEDARPMLEIAWRIKAQRVGDVLMTGNEAEEQ